MGKILVIEDDRNIQGLIEKIFPKEGLNIIKTFPRDMGSGADAEDHSLKKEAKGYVEEGIRSYLREEVKKSSWGNLHDDIIGKVEKTLIGLILEEEKGNQVKAAKRLGINRNTLRKKIKDLQITTRVITGFGEN